MNYTIYRNTYAFHTCRPEGQQEREMMVKDIVPIQFSSQTPVHLQIGDYIDVWGSRYELYELPEVTKEHTKDYQYTCTFKALYYKLSKWKFNGYDSANQLTLKRVELMLTLDEFADLLVANANRNGSGWTKGGVIETNPMYLMFDGENILEVVSQLAANFKTEWWFDNQVLNFSKRGVSTGVKFEYGYDKGLRGGLQRTNVSSTSAFSRLRVEGGTQNLPEGYRFGQTKLQLPIGTPFIQGEKYGPDEIEADIVFEDVRPERIGTVTSVGDIYTFIDSGMDFDLNTHLLTISAKVSFLTGNLAGQNFEIAKGGYNHTTKTFKLVSSELESITLPNADLHPEVGDTYYIFDIRMPDSYVTDAEARLLARGTEYFTENAAPKVTYQLPPDHFYFTRNSLTLSLGDYYHVKDFDLLLNKDIRLTGYVRDLHQEFKYTTMIISDNPQGASFGRQLAEARELKKAVQINKILDVQRARTNWRATNELATMIETVKAEMLLITMDGAAYQTDIVSSLTPTEFSTTAGLVAHDQYTDVTSGIWDVPSFIATLSGPEAQYVYVRASRTANVAAIVLSPTKIGVEDDPAVYYFPFGVISSLISGNRVFQSLRGYTRVTGGQIGTGIIVANNGESYISLDEGTFHFINDVSQISFTESGVILNGTIIATGADFIDLLVKNLRTKISGKRVQILESENNIEIYNDDNEVLIQLDDDSADEGTMYSSTTPPFLDLDGNYPKNYLFDRVVGGVLRYFYANMGPGGSVGISPTHPDGFSSWGRKGYKTNGSYKAGAENETIMDKDGLRTSGNIEALAGTGKVKDLEVTGGIKSRGRDGFTGYEWVSSAETISRGYINGVYIGQGSGMSWMGPL